MKRQIDEMLETTYGYKNISKIMDFSEKISTKSSFITTSSYSKNVYKIWFADPRIL